MLKIENGELRAITQLHFFSALGIYCDSDETKNKTDQIIQYLIGP
jgi:hypothetical protein